MNPIQVLSIHLDELLRSIWFKLACAGGVIHAATSAGGDFPWWGSLSILLGWPFVFLVGSLVYGLVFFYIVRPDKE